MRAIDLRIGPATEQEVERLVATSRTAHEAAHLRERLARQQDGRGLLLLAWDQERWVGRTTLSWESAYPRVRTAHPGTAEINALHAFQTGRGIGTAIIGRAEQLASDHGHRQIGLAADPEANTGARRLYERLGYVLWDGGMVIDRWTELLDDQNTVEHAGECAYLIKSLT